MSNTLEDYFKTYSKDAIIADLKNSREKFLELMDIAVNPSDKNAWRACWILRSSMNRNDERIQSISHQLLQILPEAKEGHQREILYLLDNIKVSEEDEGNLFNTCMNIWEKTKSQPSVRFHAFKMILKTVKKYPELASEIEFLTEPHFMDSLTHGARHSVNKLLKEFRS